MPATQDAICGIVNVHLTLHKVRDWCPNTGTDRKLMEHSLQVMPGDRERCLAAEMDDFLSKPYSKAELASKLGGPASS